MLDKMVKPDCGTFSPTPQSYYALSDVSKMSNFDSEDVSTNLTQSSSIVSDKRVYRVEKSTSVTSDEEFSEPYIMDDIDEVCKSAEIDAVPRRKGARKPRPASWCGATQLIRDEDTNEFDPERLKKLQESLKQADMEREVILSCLGKEYIERVTLQSHLQSICAKFGYRLEDLILQKSDKNDTIDAKEVSEIKQNPIDASYKVHKRTTSRDMISLDDSFIDLKVQNNTCFDINKLTRDNGKGESMDKIKQQTKDTITRLNEAEQRKSTMKFSHAVCTSTPQPGEKDLSSRNYKSEENIATKATLREILKDPKNSSASVVMDSNFQSTSVGLSNGLNMGNRTKDSEISDQSPSSGNDGQVFSDSKQKRGHMDFSDIGNIEGHSSNLRNYADRVRTASETSTELAGEYKAVSIEKCSNNEDRSKSFIMDGLKPKQRPATRAEYDNTVSKRSTSECKIVDEDIVELKDFLTDLIEENQKAAKRIVLLEKRMAKSGEKDEIDSSRSDSMSGNSHRHLFNRRRSYTTDDVHESVHSQSTFIRSHKRRSSYSEGRTTPTSSSVNSRLFKSTLSSQQKMKPKLHKKQSRSSDSLFSTSVDAVDYENSHKSLIDREDKRISCQSPDVKEIVVTNDDNMKTVFCQASYDTNTFQYIYTIDAEMSNKEYNKLLSIINMLQEQRRKWETEVRELQTKVDILGKDKVEVVRNNNLLRQSLEAANKAIREINSKVQELKRTIVPLRDDNSKLKEQNQTYRHRFENFRKDKLKLVQEIQDLKKIKIKLEEKISHFEAKQEIRKMGKITEESIEEKENKESYAENEVNMLQENDQFQKINGEHIQVLSRTFEENKKSVIVEAAESMRTIDHFYSEQQVSTSKLQTAQNTQADNHVDKVTSCTEKESNRSKEHQYNQKKSSSNVEQFINRNLSVEGKLSDSTCIKGSHGLYQDVQKHATENRKETVSRLSSTSIDSVDHMEKFQERRKEKDVDKETVEGVEYHSKKNDEQQLMEEDHTGEGRVSQQVQMIEKREKNVTVDQKSTQNISLVTEVNTSNIEIIKNDDERLRDIEEQNVTLMTELQNLRNRLQAYEETVATNQQAFLSQQNQETKRVDEIQTRQEQLLQTSEGTIQRQLEKEEEHLINELTRRSPMSDRGRVSASQSTEDVSRNREVADKTQKRRSLELLSPIHTAVIGYPLDNNNQEESHGYAQVQKESGMSRWASFSQDSLLDIKEIATRTKTEMDEMRKSSAVKHGTTVHAISRDREDSNKHIVKHTSYKRPVAVPDRDNKADTQAIGSGHVRFSTNRQVSMTGESKNVSGSSRYRAEINMKDIAARSHQEEVTRDASEISQQEQLQNSMGVVSKDYNQEHDIASPDVKGSVKFFESYASRIGKRDMQQQSSNRERHESLTDWEVQQITQGRQTSDKRYEKKGDSKEIRQRRSLSSERNERRSDVNVVSHEKRQSAHMAENVSVRRRDDDIIQSVQVGSHSRGKQTRSNEIEESVQDKSYARRTKEFSDVQATSQDRSSVVQRSKVSSDLREMKQEGRQSMQTADIVHDSSGVVKDNDYVLIRSDATNTTSSKFHVQQRSVSEERDKQVRSNKTSVRAVSYDSSNKSASRGGEFDGKSKHIVLADQDTHHGQTQRVIEDGSINKDNKQIRQGRNLRQHTDRQRSQSLQNRVERRSLSETSDYVSVANTQSSIQQSYANIEGTNLGIQVSQRIERNPQEPPKKPVRGILIEKEKGVSQKHAQEALLLHQQSSMEYQRSEEKKVVASSVHNNTSDTGRLLDKVDGHRRDVVRGIRNRENYNVGRVDTDDSTDESRAVHTKITKDNQETINSGTNVNIAQTSIRVCQETNSAVHEQEVTARQSQEVQSAHEQTNQKDEKNSTNVLYLDELSAEPPPGSLGRSRRTRSLRVRPKSEIYGGKQNGELSSNQQKQLHMNNTFHRVGSVRTKRDMDRERARRENRPLSLSESNLLFRSGVDVAMRHTVRHVYGDQEHSQAHAHAVGSEVAYDDRGHLHYHSQEILKADGLSVSQTNSRFCHDADCHAGSATLPKSHKNFRTSGKFNCEMCKDLSKRKHVSENRYCREKYFPIAHTDFV